MKPIFTYDNYKAWANDWVAAQPKRGYGQFRRMAAYLGTNSAAVSQIFRGDRDLNAEQAARLAEFMGLGSLEADYLLLLVQRNRAGNASLRKLIDRQIAELRGRGQAIKNRISHGQLSDEDKSTFYSHWYYVAIWLAASIPELASVSALARRFQLSDALVSDVLQFLLDRNLLVKKNGRFDFGANVIHVPHDSPFVHKHHLNWRLRALQAMDQKKTANLHYTAPVSLSRELKDSFREELVQLIQKYTKRVADAPSETTACLNLDWFEY